MYDPFKARPVSGEIMTDAVADTGPPPRITPEDRGDIFEAEFETVRSETGRRGFRGAPENAPEGIELLRNGVRQACARSERGSIAFWAVGIVLVVMAFLASGGYVLMRSGGSGALPKGEPSESLHTASLPVPDAGAERHDGPAEPHFLGTSADSVKSRGSFVFSDRLEPPKDGEQSVSNSFGEEE